jgi:hypothetical protein
MPLLALPRSSPRLLLRGRLVRPVRERAHRARAGDGQIPHQGSPPVNASVRTRTSDSVDMVLLAGIRESANDDGHFQRNRA